jgi:hypothetical protein
MIVMKSSLQAEMLQDFEAEVGELKKLLATQESVKGGKEYAEKRLWVVEESVKELKKQIADGGRHFSQYEGGYSPEEAKRFEQFKNGDTRV